MQDPNMQKKRLSCPTSCVILIFTLLIVGATGGPACRGDIRHQQGTESIKASHQTLLPRDITDRLQESMDFSVDPCQDFNQFVCGNFIKNSQIPQDSYYISTLLPIREEIYRQGKILLESEPLEESFESDAKAQTYYKTCMDQEAIEEQGLSPVKDLLNQLGGWPVLAENNDWNEKEFEWYTYTEEMVKFGFGVNDILRIHVEMDWKNISQRVLYIDPPLFVVPREDLVNGLEANIRKGCFEENILQESCFNETKQMKAYYSAMVEAATLLGAKNKNAAKVSMSKALFFEMQLANISTKDELLNNPFHVSQYADLSKSPPNMQQYLNNILQAIGIGDVRIEGDEELVIGDMNYISKIADLLSNTSKTDIANYLGWNVFLYVSRSLNKSAQKIPQDFEREVLGIEEAQEDWKRCVEASGFNAYSGPLFGLAGSMYVRKFFETEKKELVTEVIDYIKDALRTILDEAQWMDEGTKASAQKKLNLMSQNIAFPDELLDRAIIDEFYSDLEMVPNSYFRNQLALTKFHNLLKFKNLKEKADPDHWTESFPVAVVDAYYNLEANRMELPAGVLQGAVFNGEAPKYFNFGALGFTIGHEITHGFDDIGRQQDFEGNSVDWWGNETATEFQSRMECMVEQYKNHTVKQVQLQLLSSNSIVENIADNGGVKEAYLGYTNYVRDHGEESPVEILGHIFTPRQMFWVSYAQLFCTKYNDQVLEDLARRGYYAPGEFRINVPLSNNANFSEDFQCPEGSPMNPRNKCTVW